MGDEPSAPVTTACARMWRSSVPRLWLSRPWATTVTAVTSATPMVSADAVTAVRPGLRMASRRPGLARGCGGGDPAGGAAEPLGRAADHGGHRADEAGEAPDADGIGVPQ